MPDEAKKSWKEKLESPGAVLSFISALLALTITIWFTWPANQRQAKQAEADQTFGKCALKIQTPPNVKRLNGYIEDGQRYAANHSYDLAAHRFQQVIDTDPNYLGAHQDLGVVQLGQGDLKSAQTSFEAEIKLIDCLRSVPTSDLHRFAYLLDKDKTNQPLSSLIYLDRLNSAEDTAHYNLACAFAKQGELAVALDELKKAAEHHSIKRDTVAEDVDLRPVHQEADYKAVLARF